MDVWEKANRVMRGRGGDASVVFSSFPLLARIFLSFVEFSSFFFLFFFGGRKAMFDACIIMMMIIILVSQNDNEDKEKEEEEEEFLLSCLAMLMMLMRKMCGDNLCVVSSRRVKSRWIARVVD